MALRYAEGSAPAPVATTAHPGKSNSRANSGLDKTWGQGHEAFRNGGDNTPAEEQARLASQRHAMLSARLHPIARHRPELLV